MGSSYKFKNSDYDILVSNKQDVLDTWDANVTGYDKELVNKIVESAEVEAAIFLTNDKSAWVSIPFMGNFRIPKTKLLEIDDEFQITLADAKANKTKEEFILFRNKIRKDNLINEAKQRKHDYRLSIYVKQHDKEYRKLKSNYIAKHTNKNLNDIELKSIKDKAHSYAIAQLSFLMDSKFNIIKSSENE